MLTLAPLIIISIIIPFIILSLNIFIREKSIIAQEKITPFECGFSPFKKARRAFSLRFFITTLIFLIFDVEVAVLLPIRIIIKISNINYLLPTAILVTLILLLGLLHEWNNGALKWIS